MSKPARPAPPYYPPPSSECYDSPEFPVVISETERIVGKALIYQGRYVDFAITIQIREGTEHPWRDVARIDCAHSTVHLHQFSANGKRDDRTEIRKIPTDGADEDSWEVVDREYDGAVTRLTEQFADFVQKWRTG